MQKNFETRIKEIVKLKKGWHFGSGNTFSEDQVEITLYIAKKYANMYNFSVSAMPNVNGDIDIIFSSNDYFLDIQIHPSIVSTRVIFSKGIGKNKILEDWGDVALTKLDSIIQEFNCILAQKP